MRCKIIEIGPRSSHYGDSEHLRKPGELKRVAAGAPDGWLAGWFYFDEPDPHNSIYVFQMKVQPLEPWGS